MPFLLYETKENTFYGVGSVLVYVVRPWSDILSHLGVKWVGSVNMVSGGVTYV